MVAPPCDARGLRLLRRLALLLARGGLSYVLAFRLMGVPGPLIALVMGALVSYGSPFGSNLPWPGGEILPPEPLHSFRALGAILLMWGAGIELEAAMLWQGRRLLGALDDHSD